VFHVRALYYTKTLITNKCTKSFIINCNTLLRVSTLLGHLQGELFILQAGPRPDRREFTVHNTQSTAHSHSVTKCNRSVTITKSCPWRWPSTVETCRSVLRMMIKLSLCICWWLVFLYWICVVLYSHHCLPLCLFCPELLCSGGNEAPQC
jgi:hypothetical protein